MDAWFRPVARAGARALLTAALAAGALIGLAASQGAVAECRELPELREIFVDTYPTGGLVDRFEGAEGAAVMERLLVAEPGHAVAFLYSGDGPVTGKRGRYLYLVLDPGGCVLAHDWIDGEIYDRVVGME